MALPSVIQLEIAIGSAPLDQQTAGSVLFRAVGLRLLRQPNPIALYSKGPIDSPYRYSPPSVQGIRLNGVVHPVDVPPGLDPLPDGDYVFSGLYVAEDPYTAYREGNQEAMRLLDVGTAGVHVRTLSVLGIEVESQPLDVLDLTRPAALTALGFASGDLVCEWKPINMPGPGQRGAWAITQILGYLAFKSGRCQAVKFPSARHRGASCLLIFTDRLQRGAHRLAVGDDQNGQPPRDPSRCCGLKCEWMP